MERHEKGQKRGQSGQRIAKNPLKRGFSGSPSTEQILCKTKSKDDTKRVVFKDGSPGAEQSLCIVIKSFIPYEILRTHYYKHS